MELPSVGSYFAMRLAKAASKRKESNSIPRTWIQSIVRLTLHLAGFSLLTWAGFTLNMTAGLITAAISCFLLSWLNAPSPEPTPQNDMRR